MAETAPLITFHAYQQRWLQDDSRFKLGMFSRQTGKTFTTCAEIVQDCIQAEIAGRRVRWVILSRGERQAKEAVDEAIKPFCKAFYIIYNALLAGKRPPEFSREVFRGESGAEYTALEIRFPSGSRITALPANPDTARGFSANVFLDEFAFHEKSRDIWRAIFPVISKGGLRLRVTSTPNGKDNKFYELWTSEDAIWSRHRVDIHEAVAQGLDRDVDALRRGLGDEEAWRQEYELEFLETASAWLSYDLILSCEHPDAGNPRLYRGGPVFIGNDIARRRDLWVAWVFELVGDVLWTREIVEERGISFAAQDAIIHALAAKYRLSRLIMDQTGMGEKPVEDMQASLGADRVEGVLLTGATPLNVATAAKQAFEDRRVRIPAGNSVLRDDLHKIRKVVGPTGSPRLLADRDSKGHADRAWACFLAVSGALSGVVEYAYTPASPAGNGPGQGGSDDEFDDDDAFCGRARFGRGAY